MRAIKFRGKVTGNPSFFVHGDLLQVKESCYIINYDYEIHHDPNDCELWNIATEVIPETVGQFTGLTDKNGVEIYEGDEVKYYQPYANRWDTHIVKWDEKFAAFGLFEKDNEWCKESDWMKIEDVEIIGNIHAK